jgi:D-beta-D-heptose 7-phosphate kinase/D-beta-D-heptose 1-phosphate adenosyltransferase
MVKLAGVFSRLGAAKILVIGDFILDSYTIGKVRRISPEAPVPVVNVIKEELRPGGAGNVVLNLLSLGAHVVAVGRIGPDAWGTQLQQVLASEGVSTTGLFVQPGYPTPVKTRIIADGQQIVRVDRESVIPLSEQLEQQIIDALPKMLDGVKVVAISDYGKGFLSQTLLSAVLEQSRQRQIFTIVDPKGIDFTKYSGASLIKPNLGEAYAAANLTHDTSLDLVAAKLLQLAKAEMLLVTRSESGISIFCSKGSRNDFPVRIREVKDVTGAGDTVLAMLAYAVGNGLSISEAAQLSNLAAGVAIERFGCARVSLSDVARHLLQFDTSNKIFEGDHLFALQQVLQGRRVVLLDLSGHQGITPGILHHLLRLGSKKEHDLLVLIRDPEPSQDFIAVLRDLHVVDFIVIKSEEAIQHLESIIKLEEVYTIHKEELSRI